MAQGLFRPVRRDDDTMRLFCPTEQMISSDPQFASSASH